MAKSIDFNFELPLGTPDSLDLFHAVLLAIQEVGRSSRVWDVDPLPTVISSDTTGKLYLRDSGFNPEKMLFSTTVESLNEVVGLFSVTLPLNAHLTADEEERIQDTLLERIAAIIRKHDLYGQLGKDDLWVVAE